MSPNYPILVSLTGADDTVKPEDLIEISRQHPSVEWAILSLPGRHGAPRYPTEDWIRKFIQAVLKAPHPVKRAIHLCGADVDAFIKDAYEKRLGTMLMQKVSYFDRIQLNFNHKNRPKNLDQLAAVLNEDKYSLVIQAHKGNVGVIEHLQELGAPSSARSLSILFDGSGGRGVFPEFWPRTEDFLNPNHFTFGYAGKLGPDNIEGALPDIQMAAGEQPYYVDMESSLRTVLKNKVDIFDTAKGLSVLNAVKTFSTPSPARARPAP